MNVIFVMILTFWSDAITTQEFTSQVACEQAGAVAQQKLNRRIEFVCVQK